MLSNICVLIYVQDHINYTIGCQSFNLKQFDIAKSAFKHLLTANSQQSLPQQTAFLREYLSVFKVRISFLWILNQFIHSLVYIRAAEIND